MLPCALSYFLWGENQFLWIRRKLLHHPHLHKQFNHPQVFLFSWTCNKHSLKPRSFSKGKQTRRTSLVLLSQILLLFELMYHYFLPPMSCSMIYLEPFAHTGKKNFYVYLYLQLVYQFNWNWSAGLTSRGQHELKEHVNMEKICASLCHWMGVLPARCLLWLDRNL